MNIVWTKEKIEGPVKANISLAGVIKDLGLPVVGSSYRTIANAIKRYNLDTSHFKGQAWNRENLSKPFDVLTSKSAIRRRMLKLYNSICQRCGLTEWLGSPLTIEVDHIDGNKRNNNFSNLTLLCPNCHSQTPTFRNRKRV